MGDEKGIFQQLATSQIYIYSIPVPFSEHFKYILILLPAYISKSQADCFHSLMHNVAGLLAQPHAWLTALLATCPIFSLSKCEEK